MAVLFHYTDGVVDYDITDDLTVDDAEEYKVLPAFMGHGRASYTGTTFENEWVDFDVVPQSYPTLNDRCCIWLDTGHRKFMTGYILDGSINIDACGFDYTEKGTDVPDRRLTNQSSLPPVIPSNVELGHFDFSTNVPCFETSQDCYDYINAATQTQALNILHRAVNFVAQTEEKPGKDFEITCVWTHGTWNQYGYQQISGATVNYRNVRGRIVEGGKLALYKIDGITDGALKYGVKQSAIFEGLQYSTDGITWHDSDTFPFDFFYRPRETEYGTFDFALTFWTDAVPIFDNETNATGYIGGTVEITDAINWPDISGEYPDEENPTGDPDDGTDWGEVGTRSFFSQQYICTEGAIQEISNALYDTTPGGLWEDIKKGLDMFGQNPMDAVISLMYYPVNLLSVFTHVSTGPNIWFGGYQFTMQSHNASKIIYPDGFFDCGGVTIKRLFKNWRDNFATRIFVDLPYCGRYELDPQKYWDKHIEVIYFIDTHTGGCIACLVEGNKNSGRNGKCLDQFNGQMGVTCPITLTDFSSYANAQINTLLGGGGQAISGAMSVGETGAHAVVSGATAGAVGAVGGAAALGAIQGAKTVYGLTMNNINKFNQTRGGSTGMLNQYVNQKPTFIFVYPETDNPSNYNQMVGGPSNAGGTVGNFSGYFEAEQIKLRMDGATQSEKEKARALLMGGVYI